MMSMASTGDRAVVGDDQRDHEQVLRRRQMIVGAGEETGAGAARVVHAVLGPEDRPRAANRHAVLAAGGQRNDMLRNADPAAIAVPAELRPDGGAERPGDR